MDRGLFLRVPSVCGWLGDLSGAVIDVALLGCSGTILSPAAAVCPPGSVMLCCLHQRCHLTLGTSASLGLVGLVSRLFLYSYKK